jgi:hypothetical protein
VTVVEVNQCGWGGGIEGGEHGQGGCGGFDAPVWPCLKVADAFACHRCVIVVEETVVGGGYLVLGPSMGVSPCLSWAKTKTSSHFSGDLFKGAAVLAHGRAQLVALLLGARRLPYHLIPFPSQSSRRDPTETPGESVATPRLSPRVGTDRPQMWVPLCPCVPVMPAQRQQPSGGDCPQH